MVAAGTVESGDIISEAAVNNASARQTRNVGDSRERCAVHADGKVCREGKHAATTALEIARNVDALPRAGTAAKHTAGCPPRSLLCAGAAANPALLFTWRLRGTRSWWDALAIADDRCGIACARRWVYRGLRCESVRALESAGVSTDAGGDAVRGINTMLRAGGMDDQLGQNARDFLFSGNRDRQNRDQVGLNENRNGRQTKAGIDHTDGGEYAQQVGDLELRVDGRAYVGSVTHIKGMRNRPARVDVGCTSSKEQAENRKNADGMHIRTDDVRTSLS